MFPYFRLASLGRSPIALLLLAAALTDPAAAQPTTCHIKSPGAGPAVTVSTDAANRTVRSGETIKVSWAITSKLDLGCRTPLYLVFSMHDRVRFAGEGFLALPLGVDGPFGLQHAKDRMRVLVPLHVGEPVAKGTLEIKVYQAGNFELAWAVVEVPKLIDKPRAKKDYAWGKEVAAAAALGRASIPIAQGKPTVVLQDRFTSEKPKRVIVHERAGFEIHEFAKLFRVHRAGFGRDDRRASRHRPTLLADRALRHLVRRTGRRRRREPYRDDRL